MLVIDAGTFIDGSGASPRQRVRLLMERGRIADIVPMEGAALPEGAEVLDATDLTVMPGLIDAHVHVMWDGADGGAPREEPFVDLAAAVALRAYAYTLRDLAAGFTTVRDMHCRDFADVALRNTIESGLLPGPRIRAGGYGLTSTGGHMDDRNGLRPDVTLPGFTNVVDTPDEARRAVRFLVKMGADHIKVNAGRGYRRWGKQRCFAPEMRPDVLQAICEEAHTAGRKVAAHSLGSIGELWAVQAGVDSLQHAHFVSDEVLQAMAEHGTWLVPTMTHCVRNAEATRKRFEAEGAPPERYAEDLILNAYDSMYRVIPRALALGVRVAVGTDAGAFGVPHGCNAQELALLTTVGMTPMQAIVAGTSGAAEVLDIADQVGTLAKGKLADLLLVRGDPLADLGILQDAERLVAVVKEGRVVAGGATAGTASAGR